MNTSHLVKVTSFERHFRWTTIKVFQPEGYGTEGTGTASILANDIRTPEH